MTAQAAPHSSGDERAKRLRSRKVYIELRVPRIRTEIADIVARKKAMKENGSETSKDAVEEMIYNNQHIVALRTELQSLEQERKAVLGTLREIRLLETGKAVPVTPV